MNLEVFATSVQEMATKFSPILKCPIDLHFYIIINMYYLFNMSVLPTASNP